MIEKKLYKEEEIEITREENRLKRNFKHLVVIGHPDQKSF